MKRGELSKVISILWAFIFIVCAAPALAQPWTITVTTNIDESDNPWTDCLPPGNNDCSLREAITVANFNGAPGDVIVFAAALDGATITLDTALGSLWIGGDTDTTIDATSLATGITIDANGIDNPLSLNSAYINIWGPITITNAGAGGAAIVLNPGADSAWLKRVTVTNNAGPGIYLNGVSNITISNSSISGNYAEGVNVRNSNSVSIANSTISNNGQNGLSSGVFIFGTSSGTDVSFNTIEGNGGNGVTVQEDFSTGNAPEGTSITQNSIGRNGFLAGNGVGIHIAGAVTGGVTILGNDIYENAAQGVLIERTSSGSNGPQNVYIIGRISPSGFTRPNLIYSNGQEGILIRDLGTQNNVVRENSIGLVLKGDKPAPNGNSGIALVEGTTNNFIELNTIRYNRYQDVLISGMGTSNNTVQNNTIWGGTDASPPVGYDNAGVVIINGATNNTVSGNNIAYHVFDGVQVVGPGTDDNIISANQIYANGRGIAVIHDYADAIPPDPDAPPFDLQTDSFTAPGPANTLIEGNQIHNNNNDGILVRRDGGGTIIRNNDITNNGAGAAGDGIRLVGASPSIENNTITDNAENGIHALVFFGQDDSPATADDDVLSQPTITGNTIGGSGAWGVLAVDTPLPQGLSGIDGTNSWFDNIQGRIRQDWYGYVRVIDSSSNPVTGLTIVIQENAPCTGTYTSAVSDPAGNYGPTGFTITSARSYFQITQAFVDNTRTLQDCTPHYVYVQSDPSINANYTYEGDYPNPSGEPGGAIESPTGSGVERYQFAELVQPLSAQADLEISKFDAPDPVTVGDNLTYTITVTNRGPDAATNVVVTDTLPSGVTFVSATSSQGSCTYDGAVTVTCDLGDIAPNNSVTITIVVTPTAPGAISNSVTVTSDTLDPDPANNAATAPTEVTEGPIGGDPPIWGSIMVFPSPEVHYGRGPNQDLNRNRRLNDCVLRYKDLQTGRIVDTKLFVSCTPKDLDIYEQTIVFVDDEKYLGAYDLATGAVRRTLYQAAHPAIWGKRVVFENAGQIALWDLDTDRVEMISVGSQPAIWEDLVVFVGPEGTLWLYDLQQRQLRDTGIRGDQPVIYEKTVAFTAMGASRQPLIRSYDVATQTVHDTGAVGSHPAIFGRYIAFQTDEAALGLDLTGDGDRLDVAIRYYDLEAGQVFNTGQLGFEPDIYEDLITFWVFEPRVQQDLNGDGDREDPIVQVYRIRQSESAVPLRVTALRVEREARALRFKALGEGIEAIRVQIYDLQGREVYATQFVPGNQLVWRVQSADGHPVANGVYLAVISVKGVDTIYRSAVQKIVVLR